MSQNEKLLSELLDGAHDKSFLFSDLQKILSACGFELRTRGDHFIYTRDDVAEIINIQPVHDDAYIAEVPELPGCMADGPTQLDALRNVEVITKEWIETAQQLGREIPQPKGRLKYA